MVWAAPGLFHSFSCGTADGWRLAADNRALHVFLRSLMYHHVPCLLPASSSQMLFAARQLRCLSLSPTTSWPAELGCLVNLRQLDLDRMRPPIMPSPFYLPASITQLRQLVDFSSCCSDNSNGDEKLRLRGLWRLQQLPALRRVALCDAVMADLTWVEVRRPACRKTSAVQTCAHLAPPACLPAGARRLQQLLRPVCAPPPHAHPCSPLPCCAPHCRG